MEVSVIVPIYGVEKYIEKSLRSLFSQTKASGVEYILVNDCTKDVSMEMARRVIADFAHLDIKIIEHEQNRGVAAARQTGLDAAMGEYTIHFDPDDLCEPKMLEELHLEASKSNADIVVCDYVMRFPSGDKYIKQYVPSQGKECTKRILTGDLAASLCNKLIRRNLFVENKICFSAEINIGEDFLAACKASFFAQSVSYLPKAYLYYIQRTGSAIHSNNKCDYAAHMRFYNDLNAFFEQVGAKEEFKEPLLKEHLQTKSTLIFNSKGEEQKKYARMCPECDEYIFSLNMPFYYKFALYFAVNKQLWLTRLIINSLKYIKFVLKRTKY